MKISYSDLAQIIHSIRETEEFDGMNGVYEFMDKLDEYGDAEVEINKAYGETVFTIEGDAR